ncbi:hypothetical protein BHM03_00022021 [Ensete ventricosum]|nr:hypothetical protein BHM03_00022021 [Ensete ventricosum]
MGVRTTTVLRKNAMAINFAQRHIQSRLSIDFSCTVSVLKKHEGYKLCAKSR